jgi:hypothetical protein
MKEEKRYTVSLSDRTGIPKLSTVATAVLIDNQAILDFVHDQNFIFEERDIEDLKAAILSGLKKYTMKGHQSADGLTINAWCFNISPDDEK